MKNEGDTLSALHLRKYIFAIIILILLIISYFILQPHFVALLSAFIFAYLIKPIYTFLNKRLNRHLAAVLCILLILLAIIGPAALIASQLISQARESISIETLQNLQEKIFSSPFLKKLSIENLNEEGSALVSSVITSTVKAIPSMLISLIVMLLATYYILVNWSYLASELQKYVPFKNKKEISNEIADATRNMVYGYFLIALIEFAIAAIGFYFSGVKYFLLFPILIAIFVFIPGLGPLFVYGPLTLYYFAIGDIATGIGVLITGIILGIGVDYFLALKIVGGKAKIHPLILFIGILGGVPLFGVFGFIIGPLILVYTLKLIQETIHAIPATLSHSEN